MAFNEKYYYKKISLCGPAATAFSLLGTTTVAIAIPDKFQLKKL